MIDSAFGGQVTGLAAIVVGTGACAAAAFTDLRTRRVPNWLTGPTVLLALALAAVRGPGALEAAALVVGVGLLLGPLAHTAGVLGGGDIKLLIGIGALVGFPDCVWLLLYTALAGGVLALAASLARGRLLAVCRGAVGQLNAVMITHRVIPARDGKADDRLPYAVAIAAGFAVLVLSKTYLPGLRVHL